MENKIMKSFNGYKVYDEEARNQLTALSVHVTNKSNPHGVTLEQLGVTATVEELSYLSGLTGLIQTQLDNKVSISDITTTLGRSTPVDAADTNYTTYMARGISLNNVDTDPLINGIIALMYE